MKFSIIIIDLILVACIVVPYYLFIRAGRRAGNQNKIAIKRILKTHELQAGPSEFWNKSYIAIDPKKQVLIFIRFTGDQPEIHLHRLKDLKACELLVQHTRNGNRKGPETLAFLGIHLHFRNLAYDTKVLPFYDVRDQNDEDYEMARAEKWMRHIRQYLPARHAAEPVAQEVH